MLVGGRDSYVKLSAVIGLVVPEAVSHLTHSGASASSRQVAAYFSSAGSCWKYSTREMKNVVVLSYAELLQPIR